MQGRAGEEVGGSRHTPSSRLGARKVVEGAGRRGGGDNVPIPAKSSPTALGQRSHDLAKARRQYLSLLGLVDI